MADKPASKKPPAGGVEPKKGKKLTIIDANETAEPVPSAPDVPETPAKEPAEKDDDHAAIAEAFADVPDEEPAETPDVPDPPVDKPKPTPKKITVSEHVEEEPAPEPVPVDEPEETEEPEEPEEPDEPEESEVPATEPDNIQDMLDELVKEDEADPIDLDISDEETPEDETSEEELAPTAPPLPATKPLAQLTNNVPTPPKPEPEIVAGIEPDKEFADNQIAHAVDEIVAAESDELLASEDAFAGQAVKPLKKSRSLKSLISTWWNTPAARWGTIVGLVLLLLLIVMLPATRYGILNAAGVRATSSMTVISSESEQPLKNAQVKLGGQMATTDDSGKVSFAKLRLGKTDIEISKRGFGTVQKSHVLGWGSNPLGSIGMTVTGTRLIFNTKDFLSGKPVANAEAVSGDFNAEADNNGKIILAVDQNADQDIKITIKADGYRDETVTVKLTDTAPKTIQMVAGRPHVFVSKRSGKLDVYKVDADGKNESVLLSATGKERDDLAVLQQPDGDYTAIISTRLGAHNKAGYLLSNLFIVNNKTAELTKLNESERIQLVDWTGDRIVFVAVTEGASGANPNRSKLYSFQIGQPGAKQIAAANYFNDVTLFKGAIYYAPSSYAVPVSSVKFFKVNPDGLNLATLLSSEVWNIFRNDYETLQLSVQQDWYELKVGSTPTKLSTAPANPKNRSYRDSPDGKRSLWVDNRDGKGVLLSYDIGAKKETILVSQSGLALPVYWLNNTTVVYRISDGHETADYVRSTNGGDAKKLKDVTATDSSNYFN